MRNAILSLLFLLSSLVAFGQNQPQWKVVHSVVLWDQTAPIPQTTLFTPQHDAVYRVSGYLSGKAPKGDDVVGALYWTDVTGEMSSTGGSFSSGPEGQWESFQSVFSPRAGTPVTYQVFFSDPSAEYTYNLVFTIELLEGSEK